MRLKCRPLPLRDAYARPCHQQFASVLSLDVPFHVFAENQA